MSNTVSSTNIDQSFHNLNRSWQTTCENWRDSEQIRFYQEYWLPIESTISSFIHSLSDVEQTIQKAQREIK